jgi:membrane protease YdiL (CAAX protease family)
MTNAVVDPLAVVSPAKAERLWFERPNDDLPFYNGQPVGLSGPRWLGVMAAVALGFAALLIPAPALKTGLGAFIPAILFFALPLATLAVLAPRGWTAIFRKVGLSDVFWMVAFALLNIVVTLLLGVMVTALSSATDNPLFQMLPTMSGPDRMLFFARTILQLFGEEVLTILPFLAIMTFLHARAGASRRWAIVGAWVVSAAMFGALHLPTYGWNWVQCLVVIGGARLVLTLPYIMTKNIWVSTGAHIINDWTLMGSVMLLSTLSVAK